MKLFRDLLLQHPNVGVPGDIGGRNLTAAKHWKNEGGRGQQAISGSPDCSLCRPVVHHYLGTIEEVKARAAFFGDKDFAAMFEDTGIARARFAQLIQRHRPEQVAEGGAAK